MKPEIIVKNMVCPRCIEAVRHSLDQLNIPFVDVQLGKIQLVKSINGLQKQQLSEQLKSKGFELLDDKQSQLINTIKSIIIEEIHYPKENKPINISTLLTQQLPYDYSYLSRLFSAVEGRTIEKFVMAQKIEKVKELLTYDELSLSQIAFQLHYSSTAYLSAQFKKMTGMTASTFKKLQKQQRKSLDQI